MDDLTCRACRRDDCERCEDPNCTCDHGEET